MWSDVAQFGVAGLSVYLMWKITSNHLTHTTTTMKQLEEAVRELIIFLKNGK